MTQRGVKRGRLVQVRPAGRQLRFQFNPESLDFTPRKPRMNSVERPRKVSATEWEGADPMEITFELMLDGYPDRSIERDLRLLERTWLGDGEEPPELEFDYRGFGTTRFVLREASVQPDSEIRRGDLARVRAEVRVRLVEHERPDLVRSPAQRSREERGEDDSPPAEETYTIVSGDTLWGIASDKLGDGQRYEEIADLNDIRDPDLIFPGDELRIPG